jgi:hypothetical protein
MGSVFVIMMNFGIWKFWQNLVLNIAQGYAIDKVLTTKDIQWNLQ